MSEYVQYFHMRYETNVVQYTYRVSTIRFQTCVNDRIDKCTKSILNQRVTAPNNLAQQNYIRV